MKRYLVLFLMGCLSCLALAGTAIEDINRSSAASGLAARCKCQRACPTTGSSGTGGAQA